MDLKQPFDVLVVGAGHAGCEAALAAARLGAKTLLVTHDLDTIGQMSCNPAIGGMGKSHLVREIDALDGAMARAIDQAGIHFRTLNASKGPAVRALRAQADRALYKQAMRRILDDQSNLWLFQQGVADLYLEGDRCMGVITQMGWTLRANAVVLTVGTFLAGRLHTGDRQFSGGRAGAVAANALAERLRALPLRVGRLKTGTPPRVDARSVNWEALERQPGEVPAPYFSFTDRPDHVEQICCGIARTTPHTRQLILDNLKRSALYQGNIEGTGPRYCPSIEDKVVRFSQPTHNVFVEPEGLGVHELYLNGLSTSLPFDVQLDFVRSIPGFEHAHLTRPGYAIEYDFFDPRDLKENFETSVMPGLFFAGQINGTTGYEEAAAQGLYAGANAGLLALGRPAWHVRRDQGYLGVLIDDLRTQGAPEPYRMFTSRAEYRLLLREDNADLRLTALGRELGLVGDHRWQLHQDKVSALDDLRQALQAQKIHPGDPRAEAIASQTGQPLTQTLSAWDLLKRPELTLELLSPESLDLPEAVREQVVIERKYEGYLKRQMQSIEQAERYEHCALPCPFDYQAVASLSAEIQEKLNRVQPTTLGQAKRIPGMTPAALSLLVVYAKKQGWRLGERDA